MSLIISRVIFHYFLYLSNIIILIILHEVHLLSNYAFPTQVYVIIFESFVPAYRHWKILWEQSPPFCSHKSSKILFKKALKKYYLAQY